MSYGLAQCPVGCMIRGSVRCFEQSVWLKYSVFLIFWNSFQAQNWAQILSIKTGPARALQIVYPGFDFGVLTLSGHAYWA